MNPAHVKLRIKRLKNKVSKVGIFMEANTKEEFDKLEKEVNMNNKLR